MKAQIRIRKNVTFYAMHNGYSNFLGIGKEITLGNGSVYAVIQGQKYKIAFDGLNTSSYSVC